MTEFLITTEKLAIQHPTQGQQNVMAICLKGVLDSSTADQLNRLFNNCFSQDIYKFVVDMSELSHIGSAGVGVFIGILDIMDENKGTLVFIQPTPKVKTTFNIFKLSAFYSTTDNRTSALKELQALGK